MRHGEAVRQVRHFPTHFRKMAKCMIYIGTYAWGKCYGKCLTCLTASPRRSRPLGGSVINGTIQQLLDTPRGEPVTANLAGTPHSADVVSSTRMWQGTHSAKQRHTAPQRGFTARHPRGCGKAPTAACQGLCGYISPMGNLEKQSKGINQ